MKPTFSLALAVIFAAASLSTSQAKPVINGTKYMDSVFHDCEVSDNSSCTLNFTKIPKGKVLTIQNVSCQISGATSSFLRMVDLKVAAAPTGTNTDTIITIPSVIVGSSQTGLTYAANSTIFAFSVGGYTPMIETRWSNGVNGDMTCTITGQFEATP